ncbi:apolipoprotein N-acyltransferase [Alloacidobacterium sp.]|uniref:apolipoprotein N-acyltransferase n=1 Tax=Alloacidobacterium sp. TaxID=2951999 RepID=UPI002D58A10A|nr:nitrilase-related carbon-nitrogen hydrolase [Alloacidobacterium sp.]HYK36926.1 nitrilase-related carbon-nitrogen hydrolase [Alloacidobacterium sp.]
MASKLSSSAVVAFCLALSAALFFLGTGLAPVWILTWLAAMPVLYVSSRVSAAEAFFIAAAAYALGGLNEWSYTRTVLPTWLVAFILLSTACVFGIAVLLFRSRVLRGKLWQAALIAPAFWVAAEYIVAIVSVHGTFGNISYSQMNFLPIVQIASVTGIWGISFCLFLFAATVAAVCSSGPGSAKVPLSIAVAIVLVCVFGFGIWRLAATPKDSPKVKVALIASDEAENVHADTPAQAQAVFQRYAEQMKFLVEQGVQVFVLPEHSGPVTDLSQPQFDAFLGQMAKQAGAYVAVGIDRSTTNATWNQERLYSSNGSFVASYNKHHLLPHLENETPGTERTVIAEPSGKWGMEICKDMDFPRLSRQYSQDGIGLLLVPAWDFVQDGWLHGRMAVLRGVESGFSIARSAKLGILTVTDDRGRVLAERDTLNAPFATVVATVPVRHDATIYSRFGNWFAWLDLALLIVLLGLPFISRD